MYVKVKVKIKGKVETEVQSRDMETNIYTLIRKGSKTSAIFHSSSHDFVIHMIYTRP